MLLNLCVCYFRYVFPGAEVYSDYEDSDDDSSGDDSDEEDEPQSGEPQEQQEETTPASESSQPLEEPCSNSANISSAE